MHQRPGRRDPRQLPEGEYGRFGARLEERDLERPVANLALLANELVHAIVGEQAAAVLVCVHAVRRERARSARVFSRLVAHSPASAQVSRSRHSELV